MHISYDAGSEFHNLSVHHAIPLRVIRMERMSKVHHRPTIRFFFFPRRLSKNTTTANQTIRMSSSHLQSSHKGNYFHRSFPNVIKLLCVSMECQRHHSEQQDVISTHTCPHKHQARQPLSHSPAYKSLHDYHTESPHNKLCIYKMMEAINTL